MGGEIGAPIGFLLSTLARAYMQGRGERQQAQSLRDVLGRVMGGMDTGGGGAPPFTEQDLGTSTDGASPPARSLRAMAPMLAGMAPQAAGGAGMRGAPSPFAPMPTREPGLWGGIKGIGSDILEGMTPGSPYDMENQVAMLSLKAAFERQALAAELAKAIALKGIPQAETPEAQAERGARTDYYKKQAAHVGEAQPPAAMNPMQQLEYDYAQKHDRKMGTGEEKPPAVTGAGTQAQITNALLKLSQGWKNLQPYEQVEQLALVNQMIDGWNQAHPERPMRTVGPEDVEVPNKFLPGTHTESRPMLTKPRAKSAVQQMSDKELLKALGQ